MSFADENINEKFSSEKKKTNVPNNLPKIDATKIDDTIEVIKRVGSEVQNPRHEFELK